MIELAWKATLVLVVAGFAVTVLRRSSAAVRHLVWLSALASLLVLPPAISLAPAWETEAVVQLSPAVTHVSAAAAVETAPDELPLARIAWGVWLAGVVVLLARTVAGNVRAAGWARRARQVGEFRVSREISVPLVCGILRPVILLPEQALAWPPQRIRVVIAHESMHVARRDTAAQALAQMVCALYWANPLVWWAASQMRKECEQACDDGVLARGEKASAYAEHLVEILRGLTAPDSKLQGGIAMIRGSELQQRLAALLNPNRNRQPVGRRTVGGALAAAAVLLVPLAALRAPAQVSPGMITGVVRDPSGAPVAGAGVSIALTGAVRMQTESSADGNFAFPALPVGTYEVSVQAPGFKTYRTKVQVTSLGSVPRLAVNLGLGEIAQSLRVPAGPPPEPPAQRTGAHSNVQASRLIRQPRPIYPDDCKAERVEGTVKLAAVVSTDGALISIHPSGPQPDHRLVAAATEAVEKWRYTPTLLNGVPVEVVTEIQIHFGAQ
jgi:TonB family protein